MKSKTCLSLFVGHCCQNFGTYMFLTQLPTYMKEILKFDIKSVRNYFNIFYLLDLNCMKMKRERSGRFNFALYVNTQSQNYTFFQNLLI